jgi:hypothetical protein
VIEISALSVDTAVFNLMASVRSWNLLSIIGQQVAQRALASGRVSDVRNKVRIWHLIPREHAGAVQGYN